MLKRLAVGLALSAALLAPQLASATAMSVTYTGFITDLNADDTIFGGHAAVGDPISAQFLYTTSVPGTRTTTPGVSDEIFGGLNFGTDPVISRAVFTADGFTFSFSPDYYDDVYTSRGFLDAYALDGLGNSSQTLILPDNSGPLNLESSFSSTGVGDTGGAATQFSYVSDGRTTVDFNATRVVVAAAPEPTVWFLMIIGVGLIGAALRRRRPSSVQATAHEPVWP